MDDQFLYALYYKVTCLSKALGLCRSPGLSDFQDFVFLSLADAIDFFDESLGQVVDLLLRAALVVVRNQLLVHQLSSLAHRITANVADRDFAFFHVLMDEFYQLLPAIFRERRNRDSDDLAIIVGIQSQLRLLDCLLNHPDRTAIPRLDDDEPWFGHGNTGELIERCGGPVVLDDDAIHE